MKSSIAILSIAILSGCASMGNVEALNDMGNVGKVTGSVLRTVDSSCKVVSGHSCSKQTINTSYINRLYGEIKQLPDYKGAGVPHLLQELQTIMR